jgi:hypothetical protein
LSTTNPTCCPDANPGCRGEKPASNRLSYGTAFGTPVTLQTCTRKFRMPVGHQQSWLRGVHYVQFFSVKLRNYTSIGHDHFPRYLSNSFFNTQPFIIWDADNIIK